MNTIQSEDQDKNFLDQEKKPKEIPALDGMYISRNVRREVDFAYHYAQVNVGKYDFRKERLLSKVVADLNRLYPRFKIWLEENGYLQNAHMPGKKLTAIKGVFKDKRSNYYCYNSTRLFLILLSVLYRHGDLKHLRN